MRFGISPGAWRQGPHPYPVPLAVYDETIDLLKSAVTWAKLGNDDKLDALRRRDEQATRMARDASGPALAAFIDADTYAGRSVFG